MSMLFGLDIHHSAHASRAVVRRPGRLLIISRDRVPGAAVADPPDTTEATQLLVKTATQASATAPLAPRPMRSCGSR